MSLMSIVAEPPQVSQSHTSETAVTPERKHSKENFQYRRRSRFSQIHIEDAFDVSRLNVVQILLYHAIQSSL